MSLYYKEINRECSLQERESLRMSIALRAHSGFSGEFSFVKPT